MNFCDIPKAFVLVHGIGIFVHTSRLKGGNDQHGFFVLISGEKLTEKELHVFLGRPKEG